MNGKTEKSLDECLKKKFKDYVKNKDNPEYYERVRREIREVKHNAAMYFGRIDDGQRRAYSFFNHTKMYLATAN